MKTYELLENELGGTLVKATEGERVIWIPTDPANSDYAEYLRYEAWVAEGKKPADFWKQEN
jgi:hypothetical protein